jgi:hypothetical protein
MMASLKRWQWMLIGLVLGAGVGLWQNMIESFMGEPAYSDGHIRSFDQAQFEQVVIMPDGPNDFIYKGVTVHPPAKDGAMWVTGYFADDRLRDHKRYAVPFLAGPMPVPYQPTRVPATGAGGDKYTVLNYLNALKGAYPTANIEVRYAWWEEPLLRMAITGAVGLVVIGGFWPTVLWILTRMGYGPAPRKKSEKRVELAAGTGPSPASQAKPKDEMAELMAKYGADGKPATNTPAAAESSSTSDPAPDPAVAQDSKQYRGEYYPVARPGKQ